ncbi:MAG: hypothetical protein WCK01_05305 [Candidatus Uhrbacteria bacterium]
MSDPGSKTEIGGSDVVRLCGMQGCCPEVEFKADGGVEIRDDFGGKVTLTSDQWRELQMVRKDT